MNKCKICNNSENNNIFLINEMQFGYFDKFKYMECSKCGCLQLIDIPDDLSKYYPQNYFSLSVDEAKNPKDFMQILIRKLTIYYYSNRNKLIIKLIYFMFPELFTLTITKENMGFLFNCKILDVGCGAGSLLYTLKLAGFNNLYGIDPYINENISYDNKIYIYKSDILAHNDMYDIIMLNHSLEHIVEQEKTMNKIYSLLNKNGICIIRIPTVSCYSWFKYKEYFYHLDAPRHIFIHSIKSIKLLCLKCGFKIKSINYDSLDATLRSKLYKKGWNYEKQNKFIYSSFGIIFFILDKIFCKILNRIKKGNSIKIVIYKE